MTEKRPPQKSFTLEGANATLPLVRVIVRDAMERWRELGRLRAEAAGGEHQGLPEARRRRTREEIERVEGELEECVREIAELGALIKDFELGLVDFPMQRGQKTVLLCWRSGEPKIAFWHDSESGYAGRRPVEELVPGGGA